MRFLVLAAILGVVGCSSVSPNLQLSQATRPGSKTAQLIVDAARDQLTWGTHYDGAYVKIAYPMGDPPKAVGVCTDVVIRALRHAGYDLQKLIHEDMKAAWEAYPRYVGRKTPDSNIDHRRVPNQRIFFKRHGLVCTTKLGDPKEWLAGDIVDWKLPTGRDHTGILTDKLDAAGYPFVIHNIGAGPMEEDVLRSWKIVNHFRFPK